MKTLAIAGVLLLTISSAQTQMPLELRLITQLPERLPYLYEDHELRLVNGSSDVALLPENAIRVRTYIEYEGGWLECRPRVLGDETPLGEVEWREIAPGEAVTLTLPANRCLCQDERKHGCDEWTVRPGIHRLKAVLETRTHEAEVPAGGFVGKLESNVMEVHISEPSGINAQVIAWARGSPMKVELLDEFPTSEYAAYFIYGYAARIDKADPARVRSLIERGLYPGSNSVPDEGGWQSLTSKGVARWQIKWGQTILREHPTFPFRDEIKVSVALGQMSLGQTEEALSTLEELAKKKDSEAAQWARAFLDAGPERADCREADEGEND